MDKKSSVFDKPYGAMTEEERAREREKYKSDGEASYSFYDEQGNKIGSGRINMDTDPSTIKKVYKQSDGSYTNIEPELKTGVYLDRVTGKITVEAPDYVLEREGFKNQLEGTLKTLSRYYKADKNYKIPMQDGTSKSVEEIISELNDPNNKESVVAYVDSVNDMRDQEYGYSRGNKKYDGDRKVYKIDDSIKLNDNYFAYRNAIALGDDLKDNTKQSIPKQLAEAAFLRALESYDEATSTVDYKDLMENGWNRDKHSDEEIKQLDEALNRYFANGDYEDTDELARNIALYEFVHGRDPDVAWYRNVAETTGRLFQGAGRFGGDVLAYGGATIVGGLEKAANDINDFIYQRGDTKGLLEQSFDKMLGDWETFKEDELKDIEFLSDAQAGAVEVGYGIAKLATLIAVGNALSGVAKSAAAALGSAAKAADAANATSNVANALLVGGKLGEGSIAAVGTLNTLQTMANGMSIIAKVASPQTLAGMANVITALTESKVASTIIGLVGETFGESISANPKIFYEVVTSGDLTDEAKQHLWDDFLGNSVGLAVGVTAAKGLTKIGQTARGRALSHNTSVLLNKISTKVGEVRAELQTKIAGFDDVEDYIKHLNSLPNGKGVNKADAIAIREMLRAAHKEVAESGYVTIAGKTTDEILAQLDEAEEATFKLIQMNNAIDAMRARGKSIAAEWYLSGKYRDFEGANKALEDAYDVLNKAEKAANIRAFRKVGKLAVSQDTSNYIQSMAKKDIIENILENGKNLKSDTIKGFQDELKNIEDIIANYKSSATQEMIDAANNVLAKSREWTAAANDLLMDEGLLDVDYINELRASGLWGENGELYVPLFHEKDLDKINEFKINRIHRNTVEKPYHYVAGAKSDDYLDPIASTRLYMRKFADMKARQDVAKVYTSLKNAKSELLFDGETTEYVRKVGQDMQKASADELQSAAKDMAKQIRASKFTDDFLDRAAAKYKLGGAERKVTSAENRLAQKLGSTLEDVKVTNPLYVKAITGQTDEITQNGMALTTYSISDETANEIWTQGIYGKNPKPEDLANPISVKDMVVNEYSSLPKNTRSLISSRVQLNNELKGQSLLKHATASDVNDIVYVKTGHKSLGEALSAENFDSMTAAKKRKMLEDIFGKEKGQEIWDNAAELAHGTAEHKFVSGLGSDLVMDAQKESALAEELDRVRFLRAHRGRKMTEEDLELLAKYKGVREKNFPEVTTTARKALNRAESAYNSAIEASELPDISAIQRRNEETLNLLKQNAEEETRLSREVRRVRELRENKGIKPTKEDADLLRKWMGKDLPDVPMTARAKYVRAKDLGEGLEEIPTGEGAFMNEVQTQATGLNELTVKNAQNSVNSESVMMAMALDEYGNSAYTESINGLGYTDQMIVENYARELQSGVGKNVWQGGEKTWDEIVDFDPDFERTVQRSIIAFDPRFKDTDLAQNVAKSYILDTSIAKAESYYVKSHEELDLIAKELGVKQEDVNNTLNSLKDEYIQKILERPITNKNIKAICDYHGIDEDFGNQYFALMGSMSHKADLRKALKDEFKKAIKEKGLVKDGIMKYDKVDSTAGAMASEVVDRLQDDFDEMRVTLQEIAPDMVDQKGLYAEVRSLSAQISKASKMTNDVVAVQNNLGQTELIQTDPLVASFLNHENLPKEMSFGGRINYLLSKTFRLGTTGINITSMVNQTFRDFGNAFIGGNLYRMWGQCADEMTEVLGDNVVEWIRRSDPELAEEITKRAQELGTDVNEEALAAIRRTGQSISPQVTETEVYRRASEANTELRLGKAGKGMRGYTARSFDKISTVINKAEDKLGAFNQFREGTLRTSVYNNAFADAVKRGYSYSQAKDWAIFAMNNATTNFGRLTEHFANLQQSVPFLGAAINGTKSFWRLVSVDPVGVMGRLIGGIAIPTMAFTAYSMQDEKSREVYRNIKEYEKEDNMILVANGKIISIPIPQEISSIIAPFRRMIEYSYDANPHTFWQIAANDIIGLSPIDLDGFMNVDAYTLTDGTTKDNFFVNNIEPGIAKLFSQTAPVWAKALVMRVTGIDPYTMKKIDTSNGGVDIDTGEAIVLNDYSSELGKLVAKVTKGIPILEMSAPMADKVLGSIFGTAPVSYTGWLIELGKGVVESANDSNWDALGEAISSVGEQFVEKGTSPVTVQQFRSVSESAWKSAVSWLYDRRQELLTSGEWQDYMKKRRNATTTEELEKLKTVRDNLVESYYNDVKTVVDNLQKNYAADFTAEKYASVIALSTLYVNGVDDTVAGTYKEQELWNDAKIKAQETMYKFGFTSPRNYSAFGFIRENSKGETYMSYSTPMAILNLKGEIKNATSIHLANIDSLLEANGITTYSEEYQAMNNAVSAIYAKDKMTNADFDKIDKLYKEWDVKVMHALWPYIEEYGIEAVTGNQQLIEKLDDFIKVPTDYEVTDKGRYISRSSRLNKQRGFAGSYIKYIYNKMKGVK